MPREATIKDVLYALEFGGEMLIAERKSGAAGGSKWKLSRSGVVVDRRVAEAIRARPGCVAVAGRDDAYGWRGVA